MREHMLWCGLMWSQLKLKKRKHRCFKGQRVRPLLILLSVPRNASDQTFTDVDFYFYVDGNHHD